MHPSYFIHTTWLSNSSFRDITFCFFVYAPDLFFYGAIRMQIEIFMREYPQISKAVLFL